MASNLIGDDGAAEGLLDLGSAPHFLGNFLGIDGDLATATALGAVQCRIGAFQQFRELLAGKGINGKTERRRQAHIAVTEIIGGRQNVLEHATDFFGALFLENQWQNESEFITLDAGNKPAIRQTGAQPVRHLAQDLVAGRVAEEIVDRLETIDIGNSDGEGRWIIRALGSELSDLVHQPATVAQPC